MTEAAPKPLRVLDLFAGDGGWHAGFRERGHVITTLDLGVDGDFAVDFKRDILTVESLSELERGAGPFDVLLVSPPCTAFSVAAMGKNWTRYMGRNPVNGRTEWLIEGPKHMRAELGMRIAEHTFRLVDAYVAAHPATRYIVENPIGALRVMPFMLARIDRRSTWYCRWDDRREGVDKPRAKPTDLWTNLRGDGPLGDFPMCRPGAPDHEAAPRGAKTGTQGLKRARDRSLIPYELSRAVCLACETDGTVRSYRPTAGGAVDVPVLVVNETIFGDDPLAAGASRSLHVADDSAAPEDCAKCEEGGGDGDPDGPRHAEHVAHMVGECYADDECDAPELDVDVRRLAG